MDWFKKHVDTVIVLGGICASLIWMNGKFNKIETDMAVMKAVLIMKEVMPHELAKAEIKEKCNESK